MSRTLQIGCGYLEDREQFCAGDVDKEPGEGNNEKLEEARRRIGGCVKSCAGSWSQIGSRHFFSFLRLLKVRGCVVEFEGEDRTGGLLEARRNRVFVVCYQNGEAWDLFQGLLEVVVTVCIQL